MLNSPAGLSSGFLNKASEFCPATNSVKSWKPLLGHKLQGRKSAIGLRAECSIQD